MSQRLSYGFYNVSYYLISNSIEFISDYLISISFFIPMISEFDDSFFYILYYVNLEASIANSTKLFMILLESE